jgi:hypothetical protein
MSKTDAEMTGNRGFWDKKTRRDRLRKREEKAPGCVERQGMLKSNDFGGRKPAPCVV